ncbi:threonine synthase [Puniceicoccales bacterium CK1056]|uniref:Threonine synthase n=1 Tax=Oceanipulchritudo coccoides TaxID=2706888 RepID=A0A6B2M137_9BACT|nr:threonine synthase [Oceanipulchritudo coccoides]NDV61824.1 threonine synthase [Oceanipulchritudo coccoides]
MQYVSTRGQSDPLSFTKAVATGLAPDGGLYVPMDLPDLRPFLKDWEGLGYADLCEEFFKLFATDLDPVVLKQCVRDAYLDFSHPDTAPLKTLEKGLHVLELFHGPTLAFKDFALQLLGNLYEAQIQRTGNPINVLGATSGDTGAAAIHGLLGKEGVNIFILYPRGGVSALQERQMTCTRADNVYAIGIDGTFDDAQNSIKEVFGDLEFRHSAHLSAVNSINLARVLAQCVYYIYAFFRLPEEERENLTFVVPTGNFGNVLAGWWTQKMGLPVKGFHIATNQNDILYRLFTTGKYEVHSVHPSSAPSMDIQIASNFERFLYFHEGQDPARVREIMSQFRDSGQYTFADFNRDTFSASRATDADIQAHIRDIHEQYGYVLDPHTACGFQNLPESGTRVVLGTADPAKFPETIELSIGEHPKSPRLEELKAIEPCSYVLEPDPESVKKFIHEHITS